MKEQIPISGEGSEKSEEQGAKPKALSKPNLPKELPNVQVQKPTIVGYRCPCGLTNTAKRGCKYIPIYSTHGWDGGAIWNGPEPFTREELLDFGKGGRK